ncbi:MAG: hypothetical protein CMO82_01700 [Winogradskyella sp.]|uniref:S8 family serine peptidase n=1 Tax=Winogradskyella poriferorum TaxID=307627 RepID=A0ABU7W3J9_9FLAO|nr:hypothetical protein [Winogradskyella sp.]|tara:strand:- start:1351 stop:5163 length:3813 start_codon:yes stop_codon:yes gene_type:complete
MKKAFTNLKSFLAVTFLLGIIFNINAQDWTKENSDLYYIDTNGKVYMQPDYSSVAIYFNNDIVPESTKQNFINKLSLNGDSKEVSVMDKKGVIILKSTNNLNSIQTLEERKAFLNSYGLQNEGAYDVLPAFMIGDKQAWFTKRVTIRLNEGVDLEDISSVLNEYGAQLIKNIVNKDTYLLKVDEIENQLNLIQELHEMDVLKWGEPDFKVELVKSTNDPMYSDSWHLNNTGGSVDGKALVADIDVNAPEAWGITTGNSSIVVAVIDDGVEAHPDMPTLLTGYTPANNGNGTPSTSGDGHGQQVSGLISAQHNTIGAAGIAPGASTFSINIFDPNTSNADVADGITWAVNQGADVLSNSWGFGSCTYNVSSITDAFTYAANSGRNGKGCLIMIASGNDFQTCVSYPANLPNVMAVGGISGDGGRSMYSNYGPALDIAAPSDDDWVQQGGQWYSTGTHGLRTLDRVGSAGWYSGDYSDSMGGTSGATPQVSAVAALVLSVNPNLTKSEVENILYTTTKSVGDANQFGAGLVNAYAAVLAAGGSVDDQAPSVPSGLAASNIGSSSFDVSWNASSDNVGVTGYNVYVNGSLYGSVSGTSITISGLTPDTTYAIRVSAYDAAGNTSAQSSVLNVTTTQSVLDCSTTVSSFPYSEGFESSLGAWSQSSDDDMDWTRDSAGTPSSSTGPSSAVEGTYYVYTEASSPNYPSKEAILEGPCFDLSGLTNPAMTFQYHMYGSAMGTLRLQAKVNGSSTWTTIWSLSGNQGNSWQEAEVSLASYSTVQLRFQNTTGTSYTGDATIDDINVFDNASDTQAPTAPTSLTASNTTQTTTDLSWNASSDNVGVTGYEVFSNGSSIGTVTSTSANITGLSESTTYSFYVTAFDAEGNVSSASNTINVTTLDPVSGSGCSGGISSFPYSESFENTLGAWSQSSGDDFNWTLRSGSTPSSNTGPSSANSGSYYIYMESSSPNYSTKRAILNSPCFDLTSASQATFEFDYHMYGATSMGSLALELSDDDGSTWISVWSESGNQGNSWQTASVNLAAYVGGSIQLRFNGVTGTTWQGDMAVDAVSLSTGGGSGSCSNVTLSITFDNYPEETAWSLIDDSGSTVASGGTYGSQADGSTLNINVGCLDSGCYDFVITDTYGDGICCAYGNGSYTLTNSDTGATLASGGSFTSSETTNFCLGSTSSNQLYNTGIVLDNPNQYLKLSPNPVKDILNVDLVGYEAQTFEIINMLGQTVAKGRYTSTVDVSNLENGLYILQVNIGEKTKIERFIKE